MLLPLCFLYDIFWVFLQPLLLGGPSVMVQACATRMHSHACCFVMRGPAGICKYACMRKQNVTRKGALIAMSVCPAGTDRRRGQASSANACGLLMYVCLRMRTA